MRRITYRGEYERAGGFSVWIDRTRVRSRWFVLGPRPPGDPRTAPPCPMIAAGTRNVGHGAITVTFDADFPAPPPEALALLMVTP